MPVRAEIKQTAASTDPVATVERMGEFFATHLATSGGYVYAYSPDLKVRRGEGRVDNGVVWNQPPGTPGVGAAFLRLYEITRDPRWLKAAGAAAQATLNGQLLSGGWYNFTETLPDRRAQWCYRTAVANAEACAAIEGNKERNNATLDDNITQSNLGFLMWYDTVTDGKDPAIGDAIRYGLNQLLKAQYPNGSWPVFLGRVFPHKRFAAAWRARLPETWSKEWVKPPSAAMVLNDQLVRDTMRLLLAADRYEAREDLIAAARRTGDFLLAAQLPAPQRGWAQTYNLDLEPIWGRKFEPPAVASRETAGAIEALLQLYLRTGEKRYLDGAVEAADWLRQSRRPSGDWARFYELGTNRPLYVTGEDTLTYDDKELHKGYSLVGEFGIGAALDLVDRVKAGEKPTIVEGWNWVFEPTPYSLNEPRLALGHVDAEGRLIENDWIQSGTFIRAVRSLGPPDAKAQNKAQNTEPPANAAPATKTP
ncbi:hypothetical protein K32_16140 [Kaistia sp. 32K]|uniref:pectate lyase n=1 Tax=Kaistia sp. 32K TaxID=2795690 RepID=UPI001915B0A2|nr:pectate lyase [Kaistia sp. 32K]BCP52997.1 hypothetical protein K32_16140 [Kaistia sp. 32K]